MQLVATCELGYQLYLVKSYVRRCSCYQAAQLQKQPGGITEAAVQLPCNAGAVRWSCYQCKELVQCLPTGPAATRAG